MTILHNTVHKMCTAGHKCQDSDDGIQQEYILHAEKIGIQKFLKFCLLIAANLGEVITFGLTQSYYRHEVSICTM